MLLKRRYSPPRVYCHVVEVCASGLSRFSGTCQPALRRIFSPHFVVDGVGFEPTELLAVTVLRAMKIT